MNASSSAGGARGVVARALRWPLRFMPPTAVVPILFGSSRGHRWIAGAASHGCWLGTYEPRSQRLARELARPSDAVWDVGANVGFLTLLFSRRVGPRGQVVAFEPQPRNAEILRRHLALNRKQNVELIQAAVGGAPGRARFADDLGACQGALDPRGGLEVEVVSIDALAGEPGRRPPNLIKFDIEGGEVEALQGAERTLRAHRPLIWVETHSARRHAACRDILLAGGYGLRREVGTAPHGWGLLVADPDLDSDPDRDHGVGRAG